MQIGQFAARAGVSALALRHYEETGLLVPDRTPGGYRDYAEDDLATVARIRVILDAGLGVDVARTYLDCVGTSEESAATVGMCPALRAEMRCVEERLERDAARISRTRAGLDALLGAAAAVSS
ncbi:MerR family transcriptional regulator [Brachybacterium huguangmaarense]